MNSSLLLPKDCRTCAVLPALAPPPRLPAHRLNSGSWGTAVLPLRSMVDLHSVKLSDSALCAVTDFAHQEAFTVADDSLIEDALDPPQLLGGGEALRREQTRVCDVRTPWSELPAIAWETVQQARVGDLLEIFDAAGSTYLLVVESAAEGSVLVRGLVSRARLQRRLERLI